MLIVPDGAVKIFFTGLGSIACSCLTIRNFKKYWIRASEENPGQQPPKKPSKSKRKAKDLDDSKNKTEGKAKNKKEKKQKASKGA